MTSRNTTQKIEKKGDLTAIKKDSEGRGHRSSKVLVQDKMGNLDSAGIAVFVFWLYHRTAFPSIPGGDSGEIVAEACHLGTAHPPGYPLFTMGAHYTMKASSLFPGKSPAWFVNIACCILGALTSGLIALSSSDIAALLPSSSTTTVFSPFAGVGAILFALSPLVWEYSLGAEVFALNNFLCSLVVFLTVRAYIHRAPR